MCADRSSVVIGGGFAVARAGGRLDCIGLMTKTKRQRERKRQRVCFLPSASGFPEKRKTSEVCEIQDRVR